jgi:FkbM family methyltransferase
MKICFDIGANKGDYTQYLLDKGIDKVISVEANKFEAERLLLRFKSSNVVIVNKAISNVRENIKFYICPECDVISTADEEWKNNSRFAADKNRQWIETDIDSITIDDLIKEYGIPSHIKIDVEGYEYKAILGMSKNYCQIRFEWAEEKADEILLSIEHLIKLGYTTFGVIAGDTFHMLPDEFMSGEDMLMFMKGKLDANRKELWGMLFALNEDDTYVD